MAETHKVLGQVAIAGADTEEQLYKVPGATSAVVSSVIICNIGGTDRTFTLGVDVGDDNGGDLEAKDHIYKDTAIKANDTFIATVGLTLAATDSVNVEASHTDITISLYGTEIT